MSKEERTSKELLDVITFYPAHIQAAKAGRWKAAYFISKIHHLTSI